MEVTAGTGHMNIHYVEEDFETCEGFIARNQGILAQANISINHPFMEPWHFTENNFPLEVVNTIDTICDMQFRINADVKTIGVLESTEASVLKTYTEHVI